MGHRRNAAGQSAYRSFALLRQRAEIPVILREAKDIYVLRADSVAEDIGGLPFRSPVFPEELLFSLPLFKIKAM